MPVKPAPDLRWLDVLGVAALAVALRLSIISTDFWLDEIYSLDAFARPARSIVDIFFNPAFRHDNNHHVNTVALYLLQNSPGWIALRLPATFCGLVVVVAAMVIGAERSRATAVVSGIVTAASFAMVVYTTEARGYAYVLAACLVAFIVLRRHLAAPALRTSLAFVTVFALGLLSHPSILHFYAGALLWSGYRLRKREFSRFHAGPMIVIALWYTMLVRGGTVGGGDTWTWSAVVDRALSWTFGYPAAVVPAAVGALAAVVLLVVDISRDVRSRRDEWLFTLGVIAGPVALVSALHPPFLYPRYFLVSLVFLLLAAARTLARLWTAGSWPRAVAATILTAFMIGNANHLVHFARDGHGHAAEAIATMLRLTPTSQLVITSPSVDRWSTYPLQFYSRVQRPASSIRFVSREDIDRDDQRSLEFDWYVIPSEDDIERPERVTLKSGRSFSRVARYAAYGPSAMFWTIYRRID